VTREPADSGARDVLGVLSARGWWRSVPR
jgi:hypothetical protein